MPLSQQRIMQLMQQLDRSFDEDSDTWESKRWQPVGASLVAHAAEVARPEYLPNLLRLASLAPDGGAEFSEDLGFGSLAWAGRMLATLDPGDPEFARWLESPSPMVRQAAFNALKTLKALNPRDDARRAQLEAFLTDPHLPLRQAAATFLNAPIPPWAVALSAPPPDDWAERLSPLFAWATEKTPPQAEVEALVAELPAPLLLDLVARARHFPWPREFIHKLLELAGEQAPLEWIWGQVRLGELDYSLYIGGFPYLKRSPSDAIRLLQWAFADTSVRSQAIVCAIDMAARWLELDTDRDPIAEAWRKRHPGVQDNVASSLQILWRHDMPPDLVVERRPTPSARGWVEQVLRAWTPALRAEFNQRIQDLDVAFSCLEVLGVWGFTEDCIQELESLSPEVQRARTMTLLAALWRAQPGKVRYRAQSRRQELAADAPEKAPQMSEVEP